MTNHSPSNRRGMIDSPPIMRWPYNCRETIAIMLCATVCVTLLIAGTSMAWRGPGVIPNEAREQMAQVVTYIVGVVSGFLANQPTPKEPNP